MDFLLNVIALTGLIFFKRRFLRFAYTMKIISQINNMHSKYSQDSIANTMKRCIGGHLHHDARAIFIVNLG